MGYLTVYHQSSPQLPNKVLTHLEDMAATLAELGVTLVRWQPQAPITRESGDADIAAAYQSCIDRLNQAAGYTHLHVGRANREHPQNPEWRARLRGEHRLPHAHTRVWAAGRGLVYLHIGEYVYGLLCEQNDALTIPAGTAHWLDMGEAAHYVAIWLGHAQEGEGMQFTGEEIASLFATLEA
ncbi:acireductone dioxygenase [Pseudomonas sp. HR96]|uniref:acireductone dioxygenase n=1 Tax=Pseudomonas sp. HR96 TaxID=1027966 RepID=UPI002A74E41D|nr:acireductone dioxygenase [Pseudomonas sp. HR96]WPO98831.1 acireductone dioxygenase [Pseudomonas sp. HR96]